jgi:iron complex transport system substrate-binding protein
VEGVAPLRIASCIASATEIIHALGLGEFQVARSHECDWPPAVRSLPICTRPRFDIHGSSAEIDQRVRDTLREAGSVYEVLASVLDPLDPTHIVAQTQCRVCAVSLEDVVCAMKQDLQSDPQVIALEPNSLSQIYLDILHVADACGVPERGVDLTDKIQGEFDRISSRAKSSPRRPTVACIEWMEPIMGAGNWIPELVELAGGRPVCSPPAGSHSPYIDFQQILSVDPDVIVLMPCGYDLAKTREESHWLRERPAWQQLQAVQNEQVYLCDANQYMTRPGPRVLDSVRALAEMLHPGIFPPTLQDLAWQNATTS